MRLPSVVRGSKNNSPPSQSPAGSSTTGTAATSGANVDDLNEVDDSNKNIIFEIIKQLGSNTDLSRITFPTFILERKSMLERITNVMQHPKDLIAATQEPNAVDRFVHIVRWYMSGWYIAPKAVKKPLNPVLGEYYSCYWDLGADGYAYYVAEQTSHHPPKSNYWYSIPKYGIHADGLLLPRSRFQVTSAASIMEGIGNLYFADHDELYTVTQPNMYARGVLTGHLKFELGDKAYVECSKTGMRAEIEFKVKGWVSGTYNEIEAKIYRKDEQLYTLTGKWDTCLDIADKKNKKTKFFDTATDHPVAPTVRPLEEQGEFESGRLWKPTLDGLGARNHEVATEEKGKVENAQRKLAKDREANGEKFEPKLFAPTPGKLEYRFVNAEQIRKHPEDAHKLIAQLVPILPGDKFPADFDEPYSHKLDRDQAAAVEPPRGPSKHAELTDDEDEFVDAEDSLVH